MAHEIDPNELPVALNAYADIPERLGVKARNGIDQIVAYVLMGAPDKTGEKV